MAQITQKYTDHAEAAYKDVQRLAVKHGGSVASIMAGHAENVPNALKGEFVITGANKVHKAGNLARAIVVLASVYKANSIWHVTPTGRKLVVRK